MKTVFLESHHINNLNFGFGQFNYHLIKSFAETGNDEFMLYIHAKDIEGLKKEFGTGIFKYKKYYSLRRYPVFRIRQQYDLWHSMNQNTAIEPARNLPYLLTVHNISHIKDPNSYKHLDNHKKFQEKLDRSSAITYISSYAKESTYQFFNVPPVPEHVIYNGNPVREVTVPEGFVPGFGVKKPFLFTIGEITERKNFISLVQMMQYLPDFSLIIAGKKSTAAAQEIEVLAAKLNLSGRISLPGKITEAEKQYCYKHCTGFVFPSLREGFGLPVIEAMRFGKPVFISNNTSLPEIGGTLANYWDHYDPQYMAGIVEQGVNAHFANEAELSAGLIARSREFSWDTAAKHYFEVYRSLLK